MSKKKKTKKKKVSKVEEIDEQNDTLGFNTHPEEWDTCELFDYCKEEGLIDEEAEFENYMHDRDDMISMIEDHVG